MRPLITVADLRSQTVKDLVAMARDMGVSGAHSMRKEQLVKAVAKASRRKGAGASNGRHRGGSKRRRCASKSGSTASVNRAGAKRKGRAGGAAGSGSASKSKAGGQSRSVSTGRRGGQGRSKTASNTTRERSGGASRRIRQLQASREQERDLSYASTAAAQNGHKKKKKPKPTPVPGKDRIVLLVRDPYWLQACWDVTRQSVRRAEAALAEHWHTCRPVLRLIEVERGGTTSTSERLVREIQVHGGVRNWYIDIKDSPKRYRVELGYLAENGRFYAISRSNVVTTPRPGSIDAVDENWAGIAENYERIYALSGGYEPSTAGGDLQEMFEEQLRRPMGPPPGAKTANDRINPILRRDKDFSLEVDAEIIIYGTTKPGAQVTLAGEPVQLRADGTFTARLSMPDRRQLLPVVARSRDGVEERTIVLSVERNTKVLEPTTREPHS
ncbi:MAG: DUF4912 domain-containing protein [Planctomycetota bacterium]